MNQPPLNPDALEDAADVIWMRANGEYGVCRADRERGSYRIAVDAAEEAITAYLTVAQKDLERRIRTEVCRIVANASNWPTPVGARMLGRDLAEPIDKIVEAVLPVIHESSAKTQKGTAS